MAKSEAQDYGCVVPAGQLLLHDDLPGLVAIRNWLNATIQEDCLVEIDDDLKRVCFLVGRNTKARRTTDPDIIREVIDNTRQVSFDLGIPVFCWCRSMNVILIDPHMQPVRFVQPVSSSFGLRGQAREREFDDQFAGRADFDFTLRTLLEDRILYADCRFYFDHGRIFSGVGGNTGLVSSAQFEASTAALAEKWGTCLSLKKPNYHKGRSNVHAMAIRVRRHNPVVAARFW